MTGNNTFHTIHSRTLNGQQGVALLMAIIVVAFVVIISINMLTQRQLQIHQLTNIYNKEQTRQYLMAAERWAVSVLSEDFKTEKTNAKYFDGFQDAWNTPLENMDKISVTASISDLQGRLNLNNLFYRGQVQTQWLNVYRNLLTLLKLPRSLADSLQDWMDRDNTVSGSQGAEDEYYLSLKPPYRAANAHLVQLAELKMIRGYTDKIISTLQPYVYVVNDIAAVNINTADKIVLQAAMPGVSKKEILRIAQQQKTRTYQSIEEFMNQDSLKNTSIDKNLISVSSRYFKVDGSARINNYPMNLTSLIKRGIQGDTTIIYRMESPVYE